MLHPSFLKLPLAHRALHDASAGRPENSRAALRAAIAAGYGIEIDLQLSSDGKAMVFHDYALGRLTGETGPVRVRDAATLGQIRLCGSDEGIPDLAEVLDIVAGQVPLLVELKDQDGAMGKNVGELEAATAKAVQGYDGPVALMCFNPYSVACLANLAPSVARGLVTSDFSDDDWPLLPETRRAELRAIPDFERVGASFISHQVSDLESERVREIKSSGVPILCWTVCSAEQEARARQVADNVTFEGYLAELPA